MSKRYWRCIDVETGKDATIMITTDAAPMACKYCKSSDVVRFGHYKDIQQYWCKECKHKFSIADTLPKMKIPVNQIASAIGMYYDGLSLTKVCYQLKHIYGTNISNFAVYNCVVHPVSQARTKRAAWLL